MQEEGRHQPPLERGTGEARVQEKSLIAVSLRKDWEHLEKMFGM